MAAEIEQLEQTESDPKLKSDGVWIPFVRTADLTVNLQLRSAASDEVREWDQKRYRLQRKMYENDNIPPISVLDKNDVDRLAEVQLRDWDIVTKGVRLEPTPANIRLVMTKLADLRVDAVAESRKHENYRAQEVKALEGNSETPSSLSSGTEGVQD